MATRLNIPQTGEQVNNTAKLIIKSFGLQALKTSIYQPFIELNEIKADTVLINNKYQDKLPVTPEIDSYESKTYSDLPSYKSKLGTPVMSDLDIDPLKDSGVSYIQIPTVLFTVNQKKNIITTSVQGRNGTVKEYISDGDFTINVKGVLVGDNGKYPRVGFPSGTKGGVNSVEDLINLFKLNRSVTVNSWYLRQFGITEMVITDYNFPQNEGEYSVQPFEFNAISDTEFIFNLTK